MFSILRQFIVIGIIAFAAALYLAPGNHIVQETQLYISQLQKQASGAIAPLTKQVSDLIGQLLNKTNNKQ